MKSYLWLPLACLVGMLVGSWGPRAELRAREQKMEEQRQRAPRAVDGVNAFAKLVNIPAEAKRLRARRSRKGPLYSGATNQVARKQAPIAEKMPMAGKPAPESGSVTNAPPQRRWSPGDLRARIEEAQDLWRVRGEMARAKAKEKFGLDAAAEAKFNAALEDMNERLYQTVQSFAALLSEKGKMTTELGVRFMGDASAVVAESYDKVGACVPESRRDEISELNMADFIDPAVAEPLIDVQDKLRLPEEGLR
ncbi:MAG: hypothetical protein MJ240_05585 [Kiritimatiellae bacterium]|nr:hypothetical protein [Kiritimatiellia bacterium]